MTRNSQVQQGLLDDLGQRRVNVRYARRDLVDGVAQAHGLQQRLDQHGRLRADDVRAEQQPGVRVGTLVA